MKHTNLTIPCPSCEKKLEDVHHALATVFREVIKPKFNDCHISDGWRGQEAQDKAYAEKKSYLKWPNSAHNKMDDEGNPCSLAIDLFELCNDGKALWRWKYFELISDVVHQAGVPVIWGGKFKDLIDGPHFEWAGPV